MARRAHGMEQRNEGVARVARWWPVREVVCWCCMWCVMSRVGEKVADLGKGEGGRSGCLP